MQKHYKSGPYNLFRVFWSHMIDLYEKQTEI